MCFGGSCFGSGFCGCSCFCGLAGSGGGLGGGDCCGGGVVGGGSVEIARGGAAGGEHELGAFEVDAVAGEAVGDVAERLLDGGVGVEVGEQEHVVLDDGRDDVGTVGVAHVVVVHGHGAAAGAVFVRAVVALVRDGGFALVIGVGAGHDFFPLVSVFRCYGRWLAEGSHLLVNISLWVKSGRPGE